jgi:hypothetical protein
VLVSFWSEGATDRAGKRVMSPPGWLETNIVQFGDPEHIWHDPQGKALHLWMRAHTGGHMRFHILWDVERALYWLLVNMATDSMRHPDHLPADH